MSPRAMILCMRSCNTARTSDVNGRLAPRDANQAGGAQSRLSFDRRG
jgi:hypothetical protein